MALRIAHLYPLGRFHGTRWNQSPFEDIYGEWPPSPWRLLRALAARWFQFNRESGGSDLEELRVLLFALASQPPRFCLPVDTARGPAIKQYQPTSVEWTNALKKKPAVKSPKTTLVEDHYRILPDDQPIFWIWPSLTLDPAAEQLLDRLLERTLYFGRAESFSQLRRLNDGEPCPEPNCILHQKDPGGAFPVLVPTPGEPLDMQVVLANTDHPTLKGRPIPPGTTWYYAVLPPRTPTSVRRFRPIEPRPSNLLQFALGGRVLPPLECWIQVADRFRGRVIRQLCATLTGNPKANYSQLDEASRNQLSLLTGKDAAGQLLHGHSHAYFLVEPGEDGSPSGLLVFRKSPFTSAEVEAMHRASEHPLAWDWKTQDWSLRLVPLPNSTPPPFGLLGCGTAWQSVTPFVPPSNRRRFRNNGRLRPGETVESSIRRALKLARFPDPQGVDVDLKNPIWLPLHAPRSRRLNQDEPNTRLARPGYHCRIVFTEPVNGPLLLGDSAHFGLGQFRCKE